MKVYCHFNYNIFMWWCNQWSIKSFENKFFQIIQRWRCIHHMPGYCWQLNEMYMQFVVFFYIFPTHFPHKTLQITTKSLLQLYSTSSKIRKPPEYIKNKKHFTKRYIFLLVLCVFSSSGICFCCKLLYTKNKDTVNRVLCQKIETKPKHTQSVDWVKSCRPEWV